MNWYVVRDEAFRIKSVHLSAADARHAVWSNPAAKTIHQYNPVKIVGWVATVIVFGGIGLLLAWRG